jgi:opacity protein-like surface antigen
MKLNYLALIGVSALLGSPVFADTPAPGTQWYAALHGGANVYQYFNDSFSRTTQSGERFSLNLDHNVGGFGGIKLGYVFGTGTYRFALEEDLFYNGVSTNSHIDQNGSEIAHHSNMINSGAFMTNFIMRFALDKFQPYAGPGIGAYYAKTDSSDVTVGGRTFTFGKNSSGSLAWGGVAGIDYYWTPQISTFIEYNYLEYVALDVGDGGRRFGQQLVGGGFRFHFCPPSTY